MTTYRVAITSQGQISIPAVLRKDFLREKHALITENNGKITIEPVKDLLELGGSLKVKKKPLSGSKIHDLFAEYVAREYKQKLKRINKKK